MWNELPLNNKEEYKNQILAFASLTETFAQKVDEGEVGGYYWSYKGKKYRTDTYRINRKVNVYDLDGNYIKTYDCVNAISEDKKFKRKIRDCCTGYKYSVNGLVYRYENDSFDKYPTEYKNKTWFKKGIKNG